MCVTSHSSSYLQHQNNLIFKIFIPNVSIILGIQILPNINIMTKILCMKYLYCHELKFKTLQFLSAIKTYLFA